MFGQCPICQEELISRPPAGRGQAAIRVVCPFDVRHFDLVIRDRLAVRRLRELEPVGTGA